MMWHPRKAAFRAGHLTIPAWDELNIGLYSTAFGLNTVAAGTASVAFGEESRASGVRSASSSSRNRRSTIRRMTSRGVKCSPAVSLESSENFRTSSSYR